MTPHPDGAAHPPATVASGQPPQPAPRASSGQEAFQRQVYDRHYATRTALLSDQLAHPIFCEFYDRMAAVLLSQAPRSADPVRIIEFACGEGLLGAALARVAQRRGTEVDYTGSDLSQAAIGLAQVAVPGGRWVVGDATAVAEQRGPGSADLVIAKNLLHHLVDPADFLRPVTPLLARDGRVAIAEASRGSPQAWIFNLLAPRRERYFFASRPRRNIRAFQQAGLRLRAVETFSWLPYELAFAIRFGFLRRWFGTDDPRVIAQVSAWDERLTELLPLMAAYLVWIGDRPAT